ncbi:MAG: c-type cytochrome [Desulfuromonadales bacterium]|nr:c-type cytochrome [Desulfuromonadales bacterium]
MSDSQHDHADGIVEADKAVPGYFYVLFFGLIIWGVIFIAYFLLSGWSSDAEFREKMAAHSGQPVDAAPAAVAAPTEATTDGKSLFATHCSACHGEDGSGGFGSDLTAASYQYGKTTAQIRESIANGRGEAMPGFGGQFSAEQLDDLTSYLLSL